MDCSPIRCFSYRRRRRNCGIAVECWSVSTAPDGQTYQKFPRSNNSSQVNLLVKAYICCHCGDRGVPLRGKIELGSLDRAESLLSLTMGGTRPRNR